MADEKKGVYVKTTYQTGNIVHEDGTDVRVDNGHLIVTQGSAASGEIVGVYAPGVWKAVSVKR